MGETPLRRRTALFAVGAVLAIPIFALATPTATAATCGINMLFIQDGASGSSCYCVTSTDHAINFVANVIALAIEASHGHIWAPHAPTPWECHAEGHD